MEQQLFDFLGNLFSGALWIMEKLFSGIPLAKDAILWMIVVMLVMNLIVIPIRGFGASDRALARDVRSGRAQSTREIKEQRAHRRGG